MGLGKSVQLLSLVEARKGSGPALIVCPVQATRRRFWKIDGQNARSCVIRGALPSRQLKLILAWCELHKDELMQNWELARDAKPLNHVAPLI